MSCAKRYISMECQGHRVYAIYLNYRPKFYLVFYVPICLSLDKVSTRITYLTKRNFELNSLTVCLPDRNVSSEKLPRKL